VSVGSDGGDGGDGGDETNRSLTRAMICIACKMLLVQKGKQVALWRK